MDDDPKEIVKQVDKAAIKTMRYWGIWLLRVGLGIVFLWFGLLKVFNVSPVTPLIKETYEIIGEHPLLLFLLGILEVLIGFGLIFKIFLRTTIFLLWLQMGGVLLSVLLKPSLYFIGNPFFLTLEGEFVVKNIVIICASLVIGGHRIEPLK